MILVLKQSHYDPTEFTPAKVENAPFLLGLSSVMGKPVQIAFDGGRLTSDAGVLLPAEIERRLGIAERLSACLDDPRSPDRIHCRAITTTATNTHCVGREQISRAESRFNSHTA
jgi:hypothetical protein